MIFLKRLFGGTPGALPLSLRSGELTHYGSLARGQGLTSDDGRVVLALSHDGRLTLEASGRVLWNPPTTEPSVRLLLESEGRLSLWSATRRCWIANPNCVATRLSVQGDGNLVLYDGPRPVWSTGTSI